MKELHGISSYLNPCFALSIMSAALNFTNTSLLEIESRAAPDELSTFPHIGPPQRFAASGEHGDGSCVSSLDNAAKSPSMDEPFVNESRVLGPGHAKSNAAITNTVVAPSIVLPKTEYPPPKPSKPDTSNAIMVGPLPESQNMRRFRMCASFVTLFLAGWKYVVSVICRNFNTFLIPAPFLLTSTFY